MSKAEGTFTTVPEAMVTEGEEEVVEAVTTEESEARAVRTKERKARSEVRPVESQEETNKGIMQSAAGHWWHSSVLTGPGSLGREPHHPLGLHHSRAGRRDGGQKTTKRTGVIPQVLVLPPWRCSEKDLGKPAFGMRLHGNPGQWDWTPQPPDEGGGGSSSESPFRLISPKLRREQEPRQFRSVEQHTVVVLVPSTGEAGHEPG